MYMKKELVRRLMRLLVSCSRFTSETIEVVWDDPWPMDIEEEYVNVAEIAMDTWQCPDASRVDNSTYEGATEQQV